MPHFCVYGKTNEHDSKKEEMLFESLKAGDIGILDRAYNCFCVNNNFLPIREFRLRHLPSHLYKCDGRLHGIQQPPARGLRVFAEPVLAHEQRVVARVVADEATAKAVPRAIRLERRRLLLGVEVDVLALPAPSPAHRLLREKHDRAEEAGVRQRPRRRVKGARAVDRDDVEAAV